ncbi:MAG: dihydrolipoyl dehydrogenase [Candidatus Eisenbacteria bacterium]|uniref:Dihydrolipoyl dehydrogenase n=1 Tax=Eiseniibacteriota bacterium TaxID=2212470 RepID=A0A948RWE0_UNCEI|nr:dihydrolipoyl dehydrogenase [Candidatus Eisenbacteria bacterium]MBU1948345.1 dihydrolipoyl dehydrogenase [Candidatus Eisenbacteria bacterium]MBU2692238.1 dihydrolipoyl dehydrogenase [Candidatus Eisenbacteria bacterium]
MGSLKTEAEVVVIGGGPGGYVAAIRAADLGKEVVLIDDRDKLGGTCLLEGCIPSKVLINAVEVLQAAKDAEKFGFTFKDINVDLNKLRDWTDSVINKLTGGIDGLMKRRGIEVIRGRAVFDSKSTLTIEGGDVSGIEFKHCIIATGSRVRTIPPAKDMNLWTSTEALKIPEIPERLLIVGGGYIGIELGLVYAGLGSAITVVEFLPELLPGADQDLVQVMVKHAEKRFSKILYGSKVVDIKESGEGYLVGVEHEGARQQLETEKVLIAVGRQPNTDRLGLDSAGVTVNDHGFIEVNEECRTSVPHIFAIGDVVPGPMLAHKASREAHVAAEVLCGHKSAFDNRAIPAVIFTDPEIAWTGLTEIEAKQKGIEVHVGRFPLQALGRAQAIGRTDGLVKILSAPDSGLVLGVGMVGPLASELIAEGTLAIEMGATLEDIIVTIHPHPTLSESIMEAAEVAAGEAVHISPPRKRKDS